MYIYFLLLAIESLNVNDNMIFKCVKWKQILLLDVLMWVYLLRIVIRPFVHCLVHFLMLLTIESLNVNDNMIFKSVKWKQILLLVVLIRVYLPCLGIRLSFFSIFPLIASYWDFEYKQQFDVQMCPVSVKTIVS